MILYLFERWRAWAHARGTGKMIVRGGLDYLERIYLLALRGFASFFHVFHQDDPDPLHDHPWAWGRIIVWGEYREHYHDGTWQDCGPGHVVWYRDARTLHRVELLTETVATIFWHWKRWRTWGFMHSDGVWRPTPEEAQDGRVMVGWLFPRKLGPAPREAVHGGGMT